MKNRAARFLVGMLALLGACSSDSSPTTVNVNGGVSTSNSMSFTFSASGTAPGNF